MVTAHALFEGRADLNGYPFQLLGVVSSRNRHGDVGAVMAAAESLLPYGRELVNVSEFTGSGNTCAVTRRRAAGLSRARRGFEGLRRRCDLLVW